MDFTTANNSKGNKKILSEKYSFMWTMNAKKDIAFLNINNKLAGK